MALPVSNLRTIITSGTNEANVNADGHLETYSPSEVITENSTATPLSGDAVFPGSSIDVLQYAVLQLNTYSDVASATDGLSIQFSSDGTNWDHTDVYTVPAATGKVYSFQPAAQYMKVVYTNGVAGQSVFRLQVIGCHTNIKPSSHRVGDAIVDEDDAELVMSVIKAKKDGDGFDNLTATADGNLKVANVEDGLSIAKGDVQGATFIHKFGAAPDFDVADGFVNVTDLAEDGAVWEAMQYTYSATADIDYIVAEDNGDTQSVEVQGLDTNYALVTQTKTLSGNTPVALDTALIRVFRVKNNNSTDFANHVFTYVSAGTTVTAGVPQDGAKVRAVVHGDNNQTEMAIYTVPLGKTAYMRSWYASTAGAKRDSTHTIKVLSRPFGGVFQLKHKANINVSGTSYIHHQYVEPEVFAAKTDIAILMDTDIDIAGVAAGFDIVLVDD